MQESHAHLATQFYFSLADWEVITMRAICALSALQNTLNLMSVTFGGNANIAMIV